MKRIFQQITIFIGLFCFVGLLRYPYVVLPETISEYAQSLATKASLPLNISDPKISFPLNVQANTISTQLPTKLGAFPLETKNIHCKISMLALVTFSLKTNCSLNTLGGFVSSDISRRFFSDTLNVIIDANGVQAQSAAVLAPYQISGAIDLDWAGYINPKNPAENSKGEFSLEILDASYSGEQKIMGLLKLPIITGISAKLQGSIKDSKLSLQLTNLESSLGSATATLSTSISKDNAIKDYSSQIQLSLSEEGRKAFGGYLALGSGGNGNSNTTNWSISIEKSADQPLPNVKTAAL